MLTEFVLISLIKPESEIRKTLKILRKLIWLLTFYTSSENEQITFDESKQIEDKVAQTFRVLNYKTKANCKFKAKRHL